DREEGRMPERDEPGIAEDEIETHGEDREDHHLEQQRALELGNAEPRHRGEHCERRGAGRIGERSRRGDGGAQFGGDIALQSMSSSTWPHERTRRTSAITPKMRKLAVSGMSARPNVSAAPIRMLAQNAPLMLPKPPTTTTMSVVIRTSKPSP